MDCDTCLNTQGILRDEIDDPEFLVFGIEYLNELFPYIINDLSIRICRDLFFISTIKCLVIRNEVMRKRD